MIRTIAEVYITAGGLIAGYAIYHDIKRHWRAIARALGFNR